MGDYDGLYAATGALVTLAVADRILYGPRRRPIRRRPLRSKGKLKWY